MSYTPGPWHTGGTFNPTSGDPRQDIWGAHPGAASGPIVCKDVRPNDARLISAAPELLEAAKDASDMLTELIGGRPCDLYPNPDLWDRAQKAYFKARAAIAKASPSEGQG